MKVSKLTKIELLAVSRTMKFWLWVPLGSLKLLRANLVPLGSLKLLCMNLVKSHPSWLKLACWFGLLWFHFQIYPIAHQCQHNSGIHCLDQYDGYFDPTTFQPINLKLEHLILALWTTCWVTPFLPLHMG